MTEIPKREIIARRIAKEMKDGYVLNLGIGMPTLCANYIPAGVDVLLGTGGTPEGVTAAAALKCMGGEIQGLLAPRNDAERKEALELGYDLDRVLTTRELARMIRARGIAFGALPPSSLTQSAQMRSAGASGKSARIAAW